MNCQRAEVSRLLISRQRNWGRTLVPQIGHNVEGCRSRASYAFVLSHVINLIKKYERTITMSPPDFGNPVLGAVAISGSPF
jgi:hypothetical protein